MKNIFLATAIAALSISAAQAYQVELNGGVLHNSTDIPGGSSEVFGLGVDGTYYFNPVQANSGPLAEAAFIERASNVSAGYGYSQNNDYDVKADSFNVGGEFYVPNSNFYAAASLGRTNTKVKGFKQFGENDYSVQIGLLPITNLLLTFGVVGIDSKGSDETDPTLSAKYLTKLNNNDVNLEGNVQFGEDSDHIGVSGDYYLDRTLSVGASFDLDTVDGADDDYSFGVNARKFIAPNISVQGGVNVGKASDNDNFGLAVGGTYRF
ncbi:MAG TPA: putative porin [Aquirhabdus sp.]